MRMTRLVWAVIFGLPVQAAATASASVASATATMELRAASPQQTVPAVRPVSAPPAPKPTPAPTPAPGPLPSPSPVVSSMDLAPPAPPPLLEDRVRVPGRLFDLMVHVGAAIPGGTYFDNVCTAATYGAGLGKELRLHRFVGMRGELAYGYTRMVAKSPGLAGHVGLHMATARIDLTFGGRRVRPFVGGGVGIYPWTGRITERATGLQNARSVSSFGGQAVVGLELQVARSMTLAPELSWRRLTGNFSDTLWGAEVAARWRL